jgi:hypothetical protein
MAALIASLLQNMLIHLSSLSKIVPLTAMIYQNFFLLYFPVWYAARLTTSGQQGTSFASLLATFMNEWKVLIATSAFLLA